MEDAVALAHAPAPWRTLFRGGRLSSVGVAVAMMILIGWIDHAGGWEFSVYVFYAIPILFVVWRGEGSMAVILAVLCGVVWWLANRGDNPYRSEWSYHWASLGRGVYFILVAVGGISVRAKLEADRALIETLENTRRLEREILEASEHEQQRIGRDLHDGLCQQLAAIGFAARSLVDDLQARSLPEAEEAGKIEELLRESVAQTRDLARGIFPVLSGGAGLAVALDELAGMAARLTGMKVSFQDEGEVDVTDPETAMHLYRIAQEALNNALRHSHGTEVIISLRREGESARLAVVDDGLGIPENPGGRAGMGLKTMAYRARVLGAALEIRRRSPRGTMVSCVCNLKGQPDHADIR